MSYDRNWIDALKKTSLQDAMGMTDRQYHRWLKEQAKEYGQYALKDKLAHSIGDGTMWQRTRFDSDGESWRHYGFVLGEEFADYYDADTTFDLTDADINEFFDDSMWESISEGWDCTGKPFTNSIHWHRNPDGSISFVHYMSIDV